MKRIFIMLSLALEKTKCFFKQKVMLHTGWGFLQKKTDDGGSITTVMGSTSEKKVPLSGTKLWVLNNKDETRRVTCTRR
jgi:hypothetical protein